MFRNVFANKKVLVTGHLGFKGSWLSQWLTLLGAKVTGFSLDVPSEPNCFTCLGLIDSMEDVRGDVRDRKAVNRLMLSLRPDFVFHLAAQPLVSSSIVEPFDTFETNALGSVAVLEALREVNKKTVVVMITSDKVYENQEWEWGYREIDPLGGKDPYSASKAMAEVAIRSYVETFFSGSENLVRLAIGRAGNVVGGGDWAENRLVPDCMRAWAQNREVHIRNPESTRPWQHVLEPLSGYLALASSLWCKPEFHGEAFNFGPKGTEAMTVANFISLMADMWGNAGWKELSDRKLAIKESALLQLSCDKATNLLGWIPVLGANTTVAYTVEWYKHFYACAPEPSIRNLTISQIRAYCDGASKMNLSWAQADD